MVETIMINNDDKRKKEVEKGSSIGQMKLSKVVKR